ncbi:ethanolamine-phosphate cytidylyltransferase-like [Euphorbia lathyris]|uniref:ethanolamine-phosphate cytidylyltransferase-like n=1 Tax=Euphorbia lathyris TaxID=212925 RepID=UPI0033135B8F
MEYEAYSSWIWDGVHHHPHVFGGLMLTAALLGLSTSYFGGIDFSSFPYSCLDLGTLYKKKYEKKRIRVYMDGCFDLMHYGHANALRQAKALGDELVVGVVSDEEIVANKGPPVLNMEERLALVSGLKWVDEVIPSAPYAITEQFMKTLFNEHKIDYIIHGDDPCLLPDGSDAYALAKRAGRYKQIKRTEGVSSTDIVGRILLANDSKVSVDHDDKLSVSGDACKVNQTKAPHLSQFLPTSRRIVQFSNGKGPGPNSRVVYIDGAFDLFHAGHVEILRYARQLGDFLLVGIHTDQIVSEHRGKHYPLMHLHERSLSVLACRYVDEVIIGAPWEVSKDMIATFNISLVVHGTVAEDNASMTGVSDPYAVPKSMGIFQIIESPKSITTSSVSQRIVANHDAYMKRNAKKNASEKKYYSEKVYVSGD